MKLEDVKQLRTVNGYRQAQQLLDDGWRILAVCVMQDGASQYAEYHLGHDQPAPVRNEETDAEALRLLTEQLKQSQ